jgi:hypothetical protein
MRTMVVQFIFKDMFYGFAPIVGGLFILNLEYENDVFNIEAKLSKDFTKMEFYHLLILNHLTHAKLVSWGK